MDLIQARDLISAYLKEEFGKIVELREVAVTRSPAGRIWTGALHVTTRSGEVEVGAIGVSEEGKISGDFDVDHLIEALSKLSPIDAKHPDSLVETEQDFSKIAGETFSDFSMEEMTQTQTGSDELDNFFDMNLSELQAKIFELLNSGQSENLLEARQLLPRLLTDSEQRGTVLRQMGELEFHLGEIDLGLNYLEAAAREFSDRADMDSLEKVAELTLQAVGPEAFAKHPVKTLLHHARIRLNPVESLVQVPAFVGLSAETMFQLEGTGQSLMMRAGEDALKEGAPATQAFVIRSGVLSVWLETPNGGEKMVRCCFPGEFVGESSVLGGPEATCNATVRAERLTSLWRFDGAALKQLSKEIPPLRARIESARALHRLDSFFSMNETTATLDARVRDRLLGCVVAVRHAEVGETLGSAGSKPDSVYLLAQGKVEYRRPDLPPHVYMTDSFIGLRDTLHDLPLDGDQVVMEKCRLVTFDPDSLRELVQDAPPEVVAALERLE